MRLTNGIGAAFPVRAGLLATAAVAVALATGAAQAQQPQQQSPQAGASAQQPLQRAEEGLRQAVRQMGGSGTAQPQAVQQARQALDQMRQELGRIPEDRRSGEGYRTLDREVGEARETLQGDRVDSARARSAIEEVLAAVPDARTAMGTAGAQVLVQQTAPTLQLTQPPPQVSVQQPEPVITVVVPQPEIIVRQPPAQVTVQMPEPQVGVEQRQPQVRVAEAEPQVQVRPGQPQVQVQRAQPRVEIGSFEGRSAIWLLLNPLRHPGSRLFCIDTFEGGAEHGPDQTGGLLDRFHANLAGAGVAGRAEVLQGPSFDGLVGLIGRGVAADLVYVDGSHEAPDVLADLVLSFRLLRPGGVIICDDYWWSREPDAEHDVLNSPKLAIDAFTNIYRRRLDFPGELHRWQVGMRKLAG